MLAQVDPVFVFGGHTAGHSPAVWQQVARLIKERYRRYDGFVVTASSDVMPFLGPALAFMIQRAGKPIIVTGAQTIPEKVNVFSGIFRHLFRDYKSLGIRANLINAVQVAIQEVAGVMVAFGNRLLPATRIYRTGFLTLNLFEAIGGAVLGRVDFGIRLAEKRPSRHAQRPVFALAMASTVDVIELTPGFDGGAFKRMLVSRHQPLLVRAYDFAEPPAVFRNISVAAGRASAPVVLHTAWRPTDDTPLPFICIGNMTFEATLAKFLWVLGQTDRLPELRRLLERDIAGEIIEK